MVRGGASAIYRAGGGCHAHWMSKRAWTLADALERHIDQRVCATAKTIVVNSQRSIQLLAQHYDVEPEKVRLASQWREPHTIYQHRRHRTG